MMSLFLILFLLMSSALRNIV